MTSVIGDLKSALVADLASIGPTVHNGYPDRVTPPAIVVIPAQASPYVSGGPAFGEFTVAVDVLILGPVTNPSYLDGAIALVLLNSMDWELHGVDAPALGDINGTAYLHSIVHLSKQTNLGA